MARDFLVSWLIDKQTRLPRLKTSSISSILFCIRLYLQFPFRTDLHLNVENNAGGFMARADYKTGEIHCWIVNLYSLSFFPSLIATKSRELSYITVKLCCIILSVLLLCLIYEQ